MDKNSEIEHIMSLLTHDRLKLNHEMRIMEMQHKVVLLN